MKDLLITSLRFERYSEFLFQKFMLGVQSPIIQLAQNISSWQRLQGGKWQTRGTH